MNTEWHEFAEHRTRDELNGLLHHGHIIPVSRGYMQAYVTEHFPDWTWNELMAVWRAAGVVINRGGTPPKCNDEVLTIHFNGPESFAIEWSDGTVTTP